MDVTTDRLRIRDIEQDDLEALVVLWTDPAVRQGMGTYGPTSREQVRQWLEEMMVHNRAVPRFAHNSAIVQRASGFVVGWIGVGKPRKPGIGDLDFGYALLPAFHGRGYATEALAAVIEFCFATLGANSVFGETTMENAASARVMEKVGMHRAGTSEDGHVIFRILKPAERR